jgi:hypothetical protein
VPLGQHVLARPDEPPQLPVTPDLADPRIVDHHLVRPHRLQGATVTVVQRGEVLPDRIGPTAVRFCRRACGVPEVGLRM